MQIESIVIVATIAGIFPPCTKYFGKMKDVFPRQVRDTSRRPTAQRISPNKIKKCDA